MPKSKSHYHVSLDDVIHAHEEAMLFGGRRGVRDLALIQSAIGRPYTGYYRFIHQKAAALLQSLAANHGFTDGNKRTALIAVLLLLDRSGYEFTAANGEALQYELEAVILDIVTHQITLSNLVSWMKDHIRRK